MSNSTTDRMANKDGAPGLDWEEPTPFEEHEPGSPPSSAAGGGTDVVAARDANEDFFEEATNHGDDEDAYDQAFGDKTAPELENPLRAKQGVLVPDAPSAPSRREAEPSAPSNAIVSSGSAPAAVSQSKQTAKVEEEPEEPPVLPDPRKFYDVSPLVIFFDLAKAKETGTLTVKSRGQVIHFNFSDGAVVEVKTDVEELGLGAFLAKRGLCTKEMVAAAESKKAGLGGDLGSALISLGVIPPHVFLETVVEWSRSVIETGFNFNQGSAQFGRKKRVKSPVVPLGFERFRLLTESVRRGLTRAIVDKRVGDKSAVPLPGHREDGLGLEDFALEPKELRILKSVNGNTPLEDMMREGPFKRDPLPLLRLIYFAAELGLISFLDNPKEEIYAKQTAEYEALVAQFEEANFFDMLEVNEKTKDEEVTKAYHKKIKVHHPDALPNDIPAELAAAHMRLYGFYQNAHEALNTEEKRKAYRIVVDEGYRDEASAVKGIIKSRLAVKKAKVVARMHKYGEALKFIEEALEQKASDEYLQIYQAYFQFMIEGGRDPNRAEEVALAILDWVPKGPAAHEDPKNKDDELSKLADAHLFLARLYKILGEGDNAIQQYEKVLTYDARNSEAEAEVRNHKMRIERQEAQTKAGGGATARSISAVGRSSTAAPTGSTPRADSNAKPEKEAPPRRTSTVPKKAEDRSTSGIGSLFQKLVKKD